jgi:hypothetical protein
MSRRTNSLAKFDASGTPKVPALAMWLQIKSLNKTAYSPQIALTLDTTSHAG